MRSYVVLSSTGLPLKTAMTLEEAVNSRSLYTVRRPESGAFSIRSTAPYPLPIFAEAQRDRALLPDIGALEALTRFDREASRILKQGGKDAVLVCQKTPVELLAVGCNELPVFCTEQHVTEARTIHYLEPDTISTLPELARKPVLIWESFTREEDSIVALTGALDPLRRPIIISIKPNAVVTHEGVTHRCNLVTSFYGRVDFEAHLDRILNEGNLLYVDPARCRQLFEDVDLPVPGELAELREPVVLKQARAFSEDRIRELTFEDTKKIYKDMANTLEELRTDLVRFLDLLKLASRPGLAYVDAMNLLRLCETAPNVEYLATASEYRQGLPDPSSGLPMGVPSEILREEKPILIFQQTAATECFDPKRKEWVLKSTMTAEQKSRCDEERWRLRKTDRDRLLPLYDVAQTSKPDALRSQLGLTREPADTALLTKAIREFCRDKGVRLPRKAMDVQTLLELEYRAARGTKTTLNAEQIELETKIYGILMGYRYGIEPSESYLLALKEAYLRLQKKAFSEKKLHVKVMTTLAPLQAASDAYTEQALKLDSYYNAHVAMNAELKESKAARTQKTEAVSETTAVVGRLKP